MSTSISAKNGHGVYENDDYVNDENNSRVPATGINSLTESSALPTDDSFLESPDEDEEDLAPIPKRKRISTINSIDESFTKRSQEHAPKRPKPDQLRGVIIGVWSESSEVEFKDKHIVHAFLDNKDRLRTRMYGQTRSGKIVIGNMPIGAGACWVTSDKVTLDSHLTSLSSAQLKEYVKIRSEDEPDRNLEEREQADLRAVERAKSVAADYEKPGARPVAHRPYKRRDSGRNISPHPHHTPASTSGFKAINTPLKNSPLSDVVASNGSPLTAAATPRSSPVSDFKQMGVLLGYWTDSSEPEEKDKHAIFGVISGNGCFRIKVQKVTRDGRPMEGNYPVGTGSMWLQWEKLVLDPHLSTMSRKEIKEYVRIREPQLELPETDEQRKVNNANALEEAKRNVASGIKTTPRVKIAPEFEPEIEIRHSARAEHKSTAKQQAEDDAAYERNRLDKVETRERQSEKSRKEVAMVAEEAAQAELKQNLKKLNRVWVAQQQVGAAIAPTGPAAPTAPTALTLNPVPPPNEEVKFHHGIKYERKQQGPFQGKLVSAAQILNIDGEDYVEYRILTKPSF